MNGENNAIIYVGIFFVLGLVAYVFPTAVAVSRGHPNTGPILVVNLFLGWTLIGYVVALAWSLTAIDRRYYRPE